MPKIGKSDSGRQDPMLGGYGGISSTSRLRRWARETYPESVPRPAEMRRPVRSNLAETEQRSLGLTRPTLPRP